MTIMRARRWSDNDHYFGPFTYAKAVGKHAYRPWAIELSSGCDEHPGNSLRFSGFSRTLIIALPNIIRPWKEKFGDVVEPELRARIGPHYYHVHRRQYGFSFSRSGAIGDPVFLHVSYGARTHDSRTDMDWGRTLPWTSWRHVRRSLYDLDGRHVWTEPEDLGYLGGAWEVRKAAEDACPSRRFAFTDFDGEELTVRTRIEEREWRFGTGWFKWLSWFRKPIIHRSLDLRFSGETGKRKGSWKGGTIGHAINMLPDELHESAFRRYCAEHQMTFVGEAPPLDTVV
jgi:hypothetical protein